MSMKKFLIIAIVLGLVMGLGIGSASAAGNSLKAGTFGFNVGYGDSVFGDTGIITISAKYFGASDLAILAGIGVQGSTGDLDANYFGITAGVRKYLKVDDFSPFIEGKFSYATEEFDAEGVDRDAFDVSARFGAEYFLHKQFSIEGSIGFGFGAVDNNITNQDYTYFGTRSVGVSANFYF
jgi:hypothetical protein